MIMVAKDDSALGMLAVVVYVLRFCRRRRSSLSTGRLLKLVEQQLGLPGDRALSTHLVMQPP
jgi:hypothetical protein